MITMSFPCLEICEGIGNINGKFLKKIMTDLLAVPVCHIINLSIKNVFDCRLSKKPLSGANLDVSCGIP